MNSAVFNAAFQRPAGWPVLCEAVWLWAGPFPVPAGRGAAQPCPHRVRGHALVPSARDPAGLSQVGDGMAAWHFSTTCKLLLSKSLQSFHFQGHQIECHVSSLFFQYTIKLLWHKNLLWTRTCLSYVLTVSVYIHEQLICLSPFLPPDLYLLLKPTTLQNLLENISPLFQIEAVFFDRPSQNIPWSNIKPAACKSSLVLFFKIKYEKPEK